MRVRLSARFPVVLALLLCASPTATLGAPENLRDVPITVTPLSAEAIQQTGLAVDTLALLNRVRADPQGAAQAFKNGGIRVRGLTRTDFNETIGFLNGQRPLPPLGFSPALSDVAVIHARDIGAHGLLSHTGSDGSTLGRRFARRGIVASLTAEELSFGQTQPASVILQLLADPGIPGRPHRADLFNPTFTMVGVGCAKHKKQGQVCVINLSGPFMAGPTPLFAPPSETRPNCPQGQGATTPDRLRQDFWAGETYNRRGFSLAPFFSTAPVEYQTEYSRAGEAAQRALTDPGSLGLSGPFSTPIRAGYCAPRSALGDDAWVHPGRATAAPNPATAPAAGSTFDPAHADYTPPEDDDKNAPGPE